MAEKPRKSDKSRTEPDKKKTDATVQLTPAELKKISGGATGNPPTKTSPDNIIKH